MSEQIEDINPLESEVTPPEKVTRSGIKKLIEFFKRAEENDNLPIQQIETPIEEDAYTSEKEEEDDDEDDEDDD